MKTITLIIALLFSSHTFQKKAKIDFVGTWKVTEVNVDKDSPMAANPSIMSLMRSSMSRVVFIFQANHRVTMSGAATAQPVPDGEWQYDAAKSKLDIKSGAGEDKKNISMIVTKDDKGQVFFKMLNAPVTLKVHKQ